MSVLHTNIDSNKTSISENTHQKQNNTLTHIDANLTTSTTPTIMREMIEQIVKFHIQEIISLKDDIFTERDFNIANKKKNVIFETIEFFKNKMMKIKCQNDMESSDEFIIDGISGTDDDEDASDNINDKRDSDKNDSDKSSLTNYSDTESEYNFEVDSSYKTKLNCTMLKGLMELNQHNIPFIQMKKEYVCQFLEKNASSA